MPTNSPDSDKVILTVSVLLLLPQLQPNISIGKYQQTNTRDVNVSVSLFDGLAFTFHYKLTSYGSEPRSLEANYFSMRPLQPTFTLPLAQLLEKSTKQRGWCQRSCG